MKTRLIFDTDGYAVVGRLSMTIAKAIRHKSATVKIHRHYLQHIKLRHFEDLAAVGFDAETFVALVVTNFNQIREGSGNSLLLIIYNGIPKVTAIELTYVLNEHESFYEVKTATVMRKEKLRKKKLLWEKKKGIS